MALPRLSPVSEGARWPSGEGIDLALLPLTEDELARRAGLPLVRGVEDGLGPWAAIGGQLPSGGVVEFIYYAKKPEPAGVILRADKGLAYSAVLDEALRIIGLSRKDLIYVSPLAAEPTTFTDLENALLQKGIRPRAIAINRTPLDNQYCIRWDGQSADVFYFERGLKMDHATFADKAPAIRHFMSMVLSDRSAYSDSDTRTNEQSS
jgi:hypothetical protein